jgi:hypothetical protein
LGTTRTSVLVTHDVSLCVANSVCFFKQCVFFLTVSVLTNSAGLLLGAAGVSGTYMSRSTR